MVVLLGMVLLEVVLRVLLLLLLLLLLRLLLLLLLEGKTIPLVNTRYHPRSSPFLVLLVLLVLHHPYFLHSRRTDDP